MELSELAVLRLRHAFNRWIEYDLNGGCWLWSARLNRQGYGIVTCERRKLLTHRAMWQFANGRDPSGVYIFHRCDVRACCNPDHLFVGDHTSNMADMAAKGRAAITRGPLPEASQRFIIENSHLTAGAVAKAVGCHFSTVRNYRLKARRAALASDGEASRG